MTSRQASKLHVRRPKEGDIHLIESSGLFDPDWYLAQYPDVPLSSLTPAEHYLWFGARLLRDPSPLFSTSDYLEDNKDVAAAGLNPLIHFLRMGRSEGRRPRSDALAHGFHDQSMAPANGPQPWLTKLRKSTVLDALGGAHEGLQSTLDAAALTAADKILSGGTVPTISVVMPTWNREAVLCRALDSAFGQTLVPNEVLLVDDGSIDNTISLVRDTYAAQLASGQLKLIQLGRTGVSGARNAGLEAATGELIAYLDSDNYWRPDYLKMMTAFFMECDETLVAYSGLSYNDLDSGGKTLNGRPFDRLRIIGNNFIDLNVYMHRRQVYDQLGGFDESLTRLVDWDMIIRHTKLYEPAYLPFVGAEYFLDKKSLGNITRTVNLTENKAAVLGKIRTERFRRNLEEPRIAYVLWDWPALSQTFVLAELEWLVRNGFDVEVFFKIAPDRAAELTFPITAHQVEDPEELASLLEERGRTLVHAHFAYPHTTLLAWPACQMAGIPFTFFAHAVDIFLTNNVARNRIEEVMADPLCLRLFVHGDYHREFLRAQNVPEDKIAYNFQALDLDIFRDVAPKTHTERSRQKRGLFVGRFVEKKGIEVLISAASRLRDDGVVFDVYGYGPLEESVKSRAADEGLDNVFFRGPLDGRTAVRDALEACDFCIVPSIVAPTGDTEGFPTIILEAMAANRPVVATSVSSVPTYVTDEGTAFLAPPGSVSGLVDAVRRCLSSTPERLEAMLRDAQLFLAHRIGLRQTMQTYLDTWYENSIDIVLVTYNTEKYDDREETREIIRRLKQRTTTPYTLTIIDNGSDADFRKELQTIAKTSSNIRLLPLEENRFVGPATNFALAASDSVFTIYVCSKEAFALRHGWERPLIEHMRRNPETDMAGTLCHLPRFVLGEELGDHPEFARFRNQAFAEAHPKKPFRHVQGGLFILRRDAVGPGAAFSDALPQNSTDVEFSYFLESMGKTLGHLPEIAAVTVKTLPRLDAELDEKTAIAHPLTTEAAATLDRFQDLRTTRCNLCGSFDTIDAKGICTACGSSGLARKMYQDLARDWRAHRGATALMVDAGSMLARTLGERMFKVRAVTLDALPTEDHKFDLVCCGSSPDKASAAALLARLAPGGLALWPETYGFDVAPFVREQSQFTMTLSHRSSRVLRSDWRRLIRVERRP
ncbi:MAG: glycosyltransferase [Pseudomonadota bacterium]